MNNHMEIIKDVSKRLISTIIQHDITGWPPDCAMFAYQPVRPASKENFPVERKPDEK